MKSRQSYVVLCLLLVIIAIWCRETKIQHLNERILRPIDDVSLQESIYERKLKLKNLIVENPKKAHKHFFSHQELDAFKENPHVEKYVIFENCDFHVLAKTKKIGHDSMSDSIIRRVKVNDQKYSAFVFDEGLEFVTMKSIKLSGHVLEDYFVVDHTRIDRRSLKSAAVINTGTDKTLLWINMQWPDLSTSLTLTIINDRTAELDWWYPQCSYNKFGFASFTNTPILQFSGNEATYTDEDVLRAEALSIANSNGYNYLNYDFEIISFPMSSTFGWAGLAYVGARGIWINDDNTFRVVVHELGHNLQLFHSNLYVSEDVPKHNGFGGESHVDEYYDEHCAMGGFFHDFNHFNVIHKRHIEWVTDNELTIIDTSLQEDVITGKYYLEALDHINSNNKVGIKFRWRNEDDKFFYYLQYQNGAKQAPWHINGGVDVHIGYTIYNSNNSTDLIDTNPNDGYGIWSSPITVGKNWEDSQANPHVSVTNIAKICPDDEVLEPCKLLLHIYFGNKTFDSPFLPTLQTTFVGHDISNGYYISPFTTILLFADVDHPLSEEVVYYWLCDHTDPPFILGNSPLLKYKVGASVSDFSCFLEVTDLLSNVVLSEEINFYMRSDFQSGSVNIEENVVLSDKSIIIRGYSTTTPYKYMLRQNNIVIEDVIASTNEFFKTVNVLRGYNEFLVTARDRNIGNKIIKESSILEKYSNLLAPSFNDYSNKSHYIYEYVVPSQWRIINRYMQFSSDQITKNTGLTIEEMSDFSIRLSSNGLIDFYFPFKINKNTTVELEFKTTHPDFCSFISFQSTASWMKNKVFTLSGNNVNYTNDYSIFVLNQIRTVSIPLGELFYNEGVHDVLFVGIGKEDEEGDLIIHNIRVYDSANIVKSQISSSAVRNSVIDFNYDLLQFEWSSPRPSMLKTSIDSNFMVIDPRYNSNATLTITYLSQTVFQESFEIVSYRIKNCFGKLSNDSLVCSGHGDCYEDNMCYCNESYTGKNCHVPICFGISGNNTLVCNGVGACVDVDKCSCDAVHDGKECEYPSCFGIFSYNNSVCSGNGRGVCVGVDQCSCVVGQYVGDECEIPICYGHFGNTTTRCSGNGDCLDYNDCLCTNVNYGGNNCQHPKCFGILANNASVCSNSRGICQNVDDCLCNEVYYFSDDCGVTLCNNTASNSTEVCSNRGECVDYNTCVCDPIDSYGGNFCEQIMCFGNSEKESNVCYGHGNCVAIDECLCDTNYHGDNCDVTMCNNFFSNETAEV